MNCLHSSLSSFQKAQGPKISITKLQCVLYNQVLSFIHSLIQHGVALNLKHNGKYETSLRQILQNTFDLNLPQSFSKIFVTSELTICKLFYQMEIILFQKVLQKVTSYSRPSFPQNENHFLPSSQTFGKQDILAIVEKILNVLSISPSSSSFSHKKLFYLTTKKKSLILSSKNQ